MTQDAPEVITVHKPRIACDGNSPASSHPRVWLAVDPAKGWVECPYCDTRYVYEDDGSGGH